MANLIRKSALCRRYDKPFWCVFRFTVLTSVHLLTNANAKFHKVGRDIIQVRRKTFTFLYDKKIYSGQLPNLITIDQVLLTVYQKQFGVFFSVQLCSK